MGKRIRVIALAVLASGFAFASRSNAGTDMVIDNSAQAPPPVYNYSPPPPVVYYAPPPVRVVVYPTIGYCAPRFRAYGYERVYVRRSYYRPHCWR